MKGDNVFQHSTAATTPLINVSVTVEVTVIRAMGGYLLGLGGYRLVPMVAVSVIKILPYSWGSHRPGYPLPRTFWTTL